MSARAWRNSLVGAAVCWMLIAAVWLLNPVALGVAGAMAVGFLGFPMFGRRPR